MSKITKNEVKNIADLARLGLSENELQNIYPELNQIINFINQLQDYPISNLEPTYQVIGLENVWREDKVIPCNIKRSELLKNCPMVQGDYIKVKRVL